MNEAKRLKQLFPANFYWGAATSSYQIEGAWDEDGKGESIWDRFSHTEGKVDNGDTGDVANDHYHRLDEDLGLIDSLGLNAYRFSISWPRILPGGRGTVNPKGLDFYERLVDGLLQKGLEPFATVYHWDLPQILQDHGGWPARDVASAFVEYTDVVTKKLGDRVKFWTTFNEPWVSAVVGYLHGRHAPGHQDVEEMLAASHHLLLAHGLAVPVIRANSPESKVGIVLNMGPFTPASPSYYDRQAAWIGDGTLNRWMLNPITGRGYPPDALEHYGKPMAAIQEGDMQIIAEPIDYLGINYYTRHVIRHPEIPEENNLPQETFPGSEFTEMDWEVYPPGIFEILTRTHFDYDFPAYYITENGAAFPDAKVQDGRVIDEDRVQYYKEHIEYCARAIQAGVPLKGYFAWSLMDNFEWGFGYAKRFGIVHVDFETQKRTLKQSGLWYQSFLKD